MRRDELIKQAYEYGCNVALQELRKMAEGEEEYMDEESDPRLSPAAVGALGAIPIAGPLAAGIGGAAGAPEGEGIQGGLGALGGSLAGGVGGTALGLAGGSLLAKLLSRGKLKTLGAGKYKGLGAPTFEQASRAPLFPTHPMNMEPHFRNATREQQRLMSELTQDRILKQIQGGMGGGMLGAGAGAGLGYAGLTSAPDEEE
jgi:hypothetical protein